MMINMLPVGDDFGRRLAGLMPTLAKMITVGKLQLAVVVVVDGLGYANLHTARNSAPFLANCKRRRITTVAPSTTGAALASITTGTLPAEHGLLGYRIYNPAAGQITQTLKQWDAIADVRSWQRQQTVFERLTAAGYTAQVFGRPAHAASKFTSAVLTGATYYGAQRITERFQVLQQQLDTALLNGESGIFYIYVDELDKIAHHEGLYSAQYLSRLQQLDTALADLRIPDVCGLVLTADHGMVDIPAHRKLILEDVFSLPAYTQIGGEPRHRHFYLADPEQAETVATDLQLRVGASAWVGTRSQWVDAGVYGDFSANPQHLERIGDVILVPRKRLAYHTQTQPNELSLHAQHGGFDEDETGVPLICLGAVQAIQFM